MYITGIIVVSIYCFLWFAARKEQIAGSKQRFIIPFYKIATFLYKKACIHKITVFHSFQVCRDLQRLYPGRNLENLETEYYIKKLSTILAVIFIGTGFAVIIKFQAEENARLLKGGIIQRKNYNQQEEVIILKAEIGEEKQQLKVTVSEQVLTKEEAENLEQKFWIELCDTVIAQNNSFLEVTTNLNCVNELEGYPFWVEWSSNQPELISSNGVIAQVEEEQDKEAILSAVVSYGELEWYHEVEVCILPPNYTEKEKLYLELEKLLIKSEEESRQNKQWQLPKEVEGKTIHWTESLEDNSIFLWSLVLIAGLGIYFFMDKDLHIQFEDKGRKMLSAYPLIVNKIILYLGAGMTIRGACQKIAKDYQTGLEQGKKSHPIYEEILYTCRELNNGIAEVTAYENLGQRIGQQEYIKFMALLTQNLKKGNVMLLSRLREEAQKAWIEQAYRRKKAGEEASTKLLIPMVMMLGVVMVLIMIPAFHSFGI